MVKLNSYEKKEAIKYFTANGYIVLDKEKLISYLENNGTTYIGDKTDVIDQWIDLMCCNVPRDCLDENYIVRNDEDWEELSAMRFINTYRLFEDTYATDELIKQNIIKEE